MKKILFTLIMAFAALCLQAQNIQLHTDFGRALYSKDDVGDRQLLTTTV